MKGRLLQRILLFDHFYGDLDLLCRDARIPVFILVFSHSDVDFIENKIN